MRVTNCTRHFKVDGKAFTLKAYAKQTPGLLKVEKTKNTPVSLCLKMYCCSDITKEKIKFSAKGIQLAPSDVARICTLIGKRGRKCVDT